MKGIYGVYHELKKTVSKLGTRVMVVSPAGRDLRRFWGSPWRHAAAWLRADARLARCRHCPMLQKQNNILIV